MKKTNHQQTQAVRDAHYRLLFDGSPEAIFILDGDTFTDCNEAAVEMFGYTHKSELIGQTPWAFCPERQSNGQRSDERALPFIEAARRGLTQCFEWEHAKKDGTIFNTEVVLTLFRPAGRPLVQAIVRDATARKRAERERAMLEAQLGQAQKLEAIGTLAGGIAHDFNNMLMAILGNVELAYDEVDEDHPVRTFLHEIESTARRSASLTRQLLTFARKQPFKPQPLDLNATLEEIAGVLHRLIGENIRWSWTPQPLAFPIRADPVQVHQVLTNLCVNARDAIGGGSGHIEIRTSVRIVEAHQAEGRLEIKPGRYGVLTVKDDGYGMDQATQARLFEPFFTTKDVGRGTGLGLAAVYGMIRGLGGFIEVESARGKGSTFRVAFPAAEGGEPAKAREADGEEPHGTERVLVVEDETAVGSIVKYALETLGYRVVLCSSPEEGLAHADAPVDLLITDLIMPGMNGCELAESLQAARPGLACLFMTGYSSEVESLRRGRMLERCRLLLKPFTRSELARAVRQALDQTQD